MIDETNNYKELLKSFKNVGTVILTTDKKGITSSALLGVQDLESKEKTSLDTIYRIASVSKVIVALGSMKLVEKGLLDIHEDISKYLGFKVENPNFKNIPITLEQLMTQTSSIHDGEDEEFGYDGVNGSFKDVSLERILMDPTYEYYTSKTWSGSFPGTDFCYSNFGCGIVCCIIEKVSNMFYNDFIRQEVLLPLAIDGSFRICDIIHKENVASLYDYDKSSGEFILERNLSSFEKKMYPTFSLGNNFRGPAGGLFISPRDLSKLLLMFTNMGVYNNIRLFREKTIDEMKQIHWMGNAVNEDLYHKKGLQLMIQDFGSKSTYWGHFGCAYGLRSFFFFNSLGGFLCMCNGADYGNGGDHFTPFQKTIIDELIK